MSKVTDEWQTPPGLIEYLIKGYGPFFWDACCTEENCLLGTQKLILSQRPIKYDYLNHKFSKELKRRSDCHTIFMNPPYSNPAPFLRKAWEDSIDFRVVILVPTSILSCKYLDFLQSPLNPNSFIRYWRAGVKIFPLRRRTKFIHPTLKSSSPPGGCMLMIFDRRKFPHEL